MLEFIPYRTGYDEFQDMQVDSEVWQPVDNYGGNHLTSPNQGGVGQPHLRMPQLWREQGQEHPESQPYHHTPFYLRQPGANYGARRPSDAMPIMHRESAVRCANSPSPPYQSQDFHNGAPYGVQAGVSSAMYAQGMNGVRYDAPYAIPGVDGAMRRESTVTIPMRSPPPPIPGPTHHPDAHSSWVCNYALGGA
ncbi:hypothetical protein SCHPADRAFT_455968 [Schizopora paradoxa]|uniref:Uncharacterized protein n=1 Tax=Schizopora paradoxa TaxID=27342 RepID=A0A0H2RQH6_9AGAM|nr:hypothetical protein SCHPADRAFT_455968 [Schizopora paradoxa]